jgi:putative thioredoxin
MSMNNVIRVSDFQLDVIDRSRSVPVLVDFWAEWCGPCKMLGPVLERLADGADGRWVLATLDTEAHPRVAADWGIRSIPNVKLFVDGAVVNEFTGALPEHAVRQWLERAIPSTSAKTIAEARELLARGDAAAAETLLRPLIDAEPVSPEALILYARSILLNDPQKAAELVRGLEEPLFSDELETIAAVVRAGAIADGSAPLPASPVRDAYLAAARSMLAGDYDSALGGYVGIIREDRYYDDDGSRKACLAIFRLLGEEHEITLRHRRVFASALYV